MFNWLTPKWFTDFVFMVLKGLEGFLGDWGLAIIVITLIFRVILIPLTVKQMKSAAHMQAMQPKLKELQDKYQDNPQKLQEEMGKFYKENKINPLGGCLPMLLQMPIFFGLFHVLRSQLPSGTGASFYNIIPNLSVSASNLWKEYIPQGIPAVFSHWTELLPYIILVALTGVSMILPQMLQKNTGSAAGSMKTVSIVMGGMMAVVGWASPAGVLLYWVTSSLFGVGQQLLIQNKVYHDDEQEQAITVDPIPVAQKPKKPTKSSKK